jgi:hypothetical protein
MPREIEVKPLADRSVVIGLFAAAVVLIVVVASLPIRTLVGVVPDDAFYYLVVGRNIAATGVSTFDGQNLASGYHPGWMMLVTMAARCVSDGNQLVRVVVAMGLAFHMLAGWLLYRCLQRFVSGKTAALAAGFWMFGYLPLVVASFALETSLYCVAFLLSYAVYLGRIEPWLRPTAVESSAVGGDSCRRLPENTRTIGDRSRLLQRDGPGRIPTMNLLLFGVGLGLCLWARTEAIVLLACAVGWLGLAALFAWPAAGPPAGEEALRTRKRWAHSFDVSSSSLIEACRRAVLTSAAALAVILPWLVYSLHTFGTIRQASGVMKTLWMQGEISGLNWAERLWMYASRYATWLAYSMPWSWGGGVISVAAVALAWICLLAAVAIYAKRSPLEVRRGIGRVLPAVAYPLAHALIAGAIYSACFADVQCWYLSLPYLETYVVLVVLGSAICRTAIDAERSKRWVFKAAVAAGILTILGLIRYGQTWQCGFWAWQRDVYTAIEPVDRALPAGARVGCFNAGIPGYFSRRQIVNLDGLVNDAVVPYWQARRFEQYLSDAHIGFIYDEKLSMERARQFSQGSPQLEEIIRHPLTNCIVETRFLWTLKPSAHPPRKSPPNAAAADRYGRNTLKSSSPIGP